MARPRKKKQTQKPGSDVTPGISAKINPADRTPKSMVIRMGASDVGPSITQLVKDMRNVMEPHTASKLKERRANKLRDYTTMAGPLGVTHFLLFSRSRESGNTNLRLAVTPRGPTFNFRVEKYSLCKDVVKSQRRPKSVSGGVEHLTPPLLVMNNFTSSPNTEGHDIPKHLESLTTSIFQSLFPPITPQKTPLSSIRRVLLLDRVVQSETKSKSTSEGGGSYIINLRHYAIASRPVISLSKGLKRLRAAEKHTLSRQRTGTTNGASESKAPSQVGTGKQRGQMPNMHKLDDIADLLTQQDGGFTSASETELETDAEVEVTAPQESKVLDKRERERLRELRWRTGDDGDVDVDMNGEADRNEGASTARERRNYARATEKRVIKLTELGPRLRLRLIKVEEGLCSGRILWHEFITKSALEERELDERWEERRKVKEARKAEQRENVLRKKQQKAAAAASSSSAAGAGGATGVAAEDGDEEDEDEEWMDSDFDEYDDFDDINENGRSQQNDAMEEDDDDERAKGEENEVDDMEVEEDEEC